MDIRNLVIAVALGAMACASAPAPVPREQRVVKADKPPLGRVERADIEALPAWQQAQERAQVEEEGARALRTVASGATVRVFLGTWCGDSRRELSRFWKALDAAGGAVPFTIEYVAVDRTLQAPGGLAEGQSLLYVPTFIVVRDGKEVGRIVESAETSIEQDLASLLRRDRTGVISGRPGVGGAG